MVTRSNPNSLTGARRTHSTDMPIDVVRAQQVEAGFMVMDSRGLVHTPSYQLADLVDSPRGGDRTRRAYAKFAGLKPADVIAACRAERAKAAARMTATAIDRAKRILVRHGYRITNPKGA